MNNTGKTIRRLIMTEFLHGLLQERQDAERQQADYHGRNKKNFPHTVLFGKVNKRGTS